MRPAVLAIIFGFAASTLLGACGSGGAPSLMNLRSDSKGPDEFAILPVKPLEMPKNLAELPAPTPNGTNLVDPNPVGDAIAALGGKAPAEGVAGRGDAGLLSYANRGGVTQDIRSVLAAEDLEYRKRNNGRLLERLFNVTVYYKAYRAQALNQSAELVRWRAKGVPTPSAPPTPQ